MASPPPPADSPSLSEQEEENADLPLPLSASVVLDQLPRDASQALKTAGSLDQPKIIVRLSPLPNTPQLKQPRFTCSSNQRFEYIVNFVRRKLGAKVQEGGGSVFCYVNSVFAPGLDEGVGNLWRCFKVNDELVVNYSITQAFG